MYKTRVHASVRYPLVLIAAALLVQWHVLFLGICQIAELHLIIISEVGEGVATGLN